MRVFIKHREVSGVYLCQEDIHFYWGPQEQAKVYGAREVFELLKAFRTGWEPILSVGLDEATVELDTTSETVPPPRPSL